jgi:hypothetical protein
MDDAPNLLEQLLTTLDMARVSISHAIRHGEKINGYCTAISDIRALSAAANACVTADDDAFSAMLTRLQEGAPAERPVDAG